MWLLNWYFCAWFVQCLSRFSLNFSVVSAVTTSSGSEFHTGTILWLNAIFDLILASKNGPRDCFLRIFDQHLPFLALDLTPLFENFSWLKLSEEFTRKTTNFFRILNIFASFSTQSFKIAIWRKNRQIWPTWKLICEFCLVVPSISRILRLKASKLQFDAKIVKPCLLCSSFSPKV